MRLRIVGAYLVRTKNVAYAVKKAPSGAQTVTQGWHTGLCYPALPGLYSFVLPFCLLYYFPSRPAIARSAFGNTVAIQQIERQDE